MVELDRRTGPVAQDVGVVENLGRSVAAGLALGQDHEHHLGHPVASRSLAQDHEHHLGRILGHPGRSAPSRPIWSSWPVVLRILAAAIVAESGRGITSVIGVAVSVSVAESPAQSPP